MLPSSCPILFIDLCDVQNQIPTTSLLIDLNCTESISQGGELSIVLHRSAALDDWLISSVFRGGRCLVVIQFYQTIIWANHLSIM